MLDSKGLCILPDLTIFFFWVKFRFLICRNKFFLPLITSIRLLLIPYEYIDTFPPLAFKKIIHWLGS